MAAMHGHVNLLEWVAGKLPSKEENLNWQNNDGWTAVFQATANNHLNILNSLMWSELLKGE